MKLFLKSSIKVAGNKLSQIGFCKQSIFITESEEVTAWKQLKVEGVCVRENGISFLWLVLEAVLGL